MSTVQRFILSIDNDPSGAEAVVQDTSNKLQERQTTLIEVVESLGEYINDESDATRGKAITYLAQVIQALPPAFLSRQQIQVLCQFFCDRLVDDGALLGIDILIRLSRFTSEMAITTFRARLNQFILDIELIGSSIHEHFSDLSSRPQARRFEIISLVNLLMTQHRVSLRSLGNESLMAVVDLFSGERDPRNLMVVFSVFRVLIAEWDIAEQTETVFDAVFCYFPITFRPPPNDPYGITAQDLKHRLKDCMIASQLFAPHLFPQLIDKLDSPSTGAKRDVLETIAACAVSYSPQTISTYSITLWDAVKFETFNAQEEELNQLAIAALESIGSCLSRQQASSSYLENFIQAVTKECNERLQEPQQKQAQPAAMIVGTLGSTSTIALGLIARACIPPLLRLYNDASSFEMRRAVLDVTSEILRGGAKLDTAKLKSQTPLLEYKDELFQLFSQALMSTSDDETSFRLAALSCLTLSCQCKGFLDSAEIGMVFQYLDEIVLKEDNKTLLKDKTIESISTLSTVAPNLITEITFPAILAQMPDGAHASKSTFAVLDAVARLKLDRSLSSTLLRRLLSKSKLLIRDENDDAYVRAVLATIYLLLGQHSLADDPDLRFYAASLSDLVEILAGRWQVTSATPSSPEVLMTIMLGRLLCHVQGAMSSQEQADFTPSVFAILRRGTQESSLADGHRSTSFHAQAQVLQTFVLAALKRETPPPFSEIEFHALLEGLIIVVHSKSDPAIRHNALQQMALIVNKFMSAENLMTLETRLWNPSSGLFRPSALDTPAIRAGFWIIKGMVVRLTKIEHLVTQLFDLVKDHHHGMAVATGFELLLCPDEVLTRENGAVIRVLSSQRLFDLCLGIISERLPATSPEVKPNYIVALSGILKYLNSEIITPRADALLPLLLQALGLTSPGVKEAAIQTLTTLVRTSGDMVDSHAASMINRLISAATDCSSDMVKVRHAALQCLMIFPSHLKSTTLLPYRRGALKGMARALDDPRRQIRKTAVDCRTAWLNLDEPDEDD